jgi:hypothetical protein
VIFSSNIIETPKSTRDGAEKRERERKRKAPKVSSNNGEVYILRGERRFNFKNPIFFPSIIPFKKPFSKSLRNFLNSFSTIL